MTKTIIVQNGDWWANAAGRFEYTESGRHKVSQDLANFMTQDYNSDYNIGSFLSNLEQTEGILGSREHHKLRLHNEIIDTVDRLRAKQELDDTITDDEAIAKANAIVSDVPGDPLKYVYWLSVETVAGEDEPIEQVFEVGLRQKEDPDLSVQDLIELVNR